VTAKVKLSANLNSAGNSALDDVVPRLYNHLGMRIIGVVEFTAAERNEIGPEEEGDPWVKLRVSGIEIARDDNEHRLREAFRALKVSRTAYGTLTEDFDVSLADRLMKDLGGDLALGEAARMRTGVVELSHYAQQAAHADLTIEGLRKELATIAGALYKLGVLQ